MSTPLVLDLSLPQHLAFLGNVIKDAIAANPEIQALQKLKQNQPRTFGVAVRQAEKNLSSVATAKLQPGPGDLKQRSEYAKRATAEVLRKRAANLPADY